ncbi:hypothetical protein [Zavarzinella formosa]|uniref:hypothetical protein n=1 Tax=Zavarzinella formosa TaxID=360055 RepID=UPI0002D72D0D|nr:hypothetical protein [Zavarzinella formosa]
MIRMTREYVGGVLAGSGGGLMTAVMLFRSLSADEMVIVSLLAGPILVLIGGSLAQVAQRRDRNT